MLDNSEKNSKGKTRYILIQISCWFDIYENIKHSPYISNRYYYEIINGEAKRDDLKQGL